MRTPFITFIALLLLSNLVRAEKSDFDPEIIINKKEVDGKVIYSKSGFKSKKAKTKEEEKKPDTTIKSGTPTVDLYYASWDPYSNKAREFFRENHIVVNAYDVDLDPQAAARKKQLDPNFVGLPLVVINGVIIRGVDERKYKEALELSVAAPPK